MGIPEDEKIDDPCEEMARLAQSFLPLKQWVFTESYRSKKDESLIYTSQWCRVNFIWSGWEIDSGNTISIFYGRLHAPDDKIRVIWNGEECYCWHDLMGTSGVLDFLDGLTPQESAVRNSFPRIIEQFRHSEVWQNLSRKRRQPELAIKMHATVWNYYKIRLFELFDLRRPDLWEKYRQFMKELYDIEGRSPNIKPSLDKVC